MWRYHEVLPVDGSRRPREPRRGLHARSSPPRASASASVSPASWSRTRPTTPPAPSRPAGLSMAVSMARALGATDVCLPVGGQRRQRPRRLRRPGRAPGPRLPAPGHRPPVRPRDRGLRGPRRDRGRPDQRRRPGVRRAGEGARLVRVRHAQGALPGRGQEDPRLRARRAAGDWKLPDAILYPTGGGTGLVGMWKAFEELEEMGFIGSDRPRMYAVQAEGCAPMVKAFSEGLRGSSLLGGCRDPRPRPAGPVGPRRLPDPARPAGEPRGGHGGQRGGDPPGRPGRLRDRRASSWPPRAAPAWPRPASSRPRDTSAPTTRSSSSTPAPATSTSRT